MSFLASNVWASDITIKKGNTASFTYKVVTPPTTTPVSLILVKEFLRISAGDTSQDNVLNLLIKSATDFAEMFTKRDFINRTWETFRNCFEPQFQLRRSPLDTVNSVEYLLNGSFVPVSASIFSNTLETDYSFVFRLRDQDWPTDKDDLPQSIKIEFVSGFGAADTQVPGKLRAALLQHITSLYENRGDCPCDSVNSVPGSALAVYKQFRINDISIVPRVF